MAAWVALAVGCSSELCPAELWAPCDARDEACVERVFRAVQCERGNAGEGTAPSLRVIDPETYRAELVARTLDATPTPHLDAALRMLGVIDAEDAELTAWIESRVRGVAAFYSPADNAITVIDRGVSMSGEADLGLLAHEVTHATQHQRYDLVARLSAPETSRDDFERRALVEGDAFFFASFYLARQRGDDPDQLEWTRWQARFLQELLDEIYLQTAPLHPAMSWLINPLGVRWVSARWAEAGIEGIDALWHEPNPSATELARGPAASALDAARLITCAAPSAPADMSAREGDSYGPAGVYAFLATSTLVVSDAWAVSSHVVDDRLAVYGDDVGERSAFQWRIRFSHRDRALAFEFATQAWCEAHGLNLATQDADVVIRGAMRAGELDPSTLESWSAGALDCAD